MSTMEPNQGTRPVSSNTTNRCDRCGAQAYAEALLMSGLSLLFCAHHWREVKDGIAPVLASAVDETIHLVADTMPAPMVDA